MNNAAMASAVQKVAKPKFKSRTALRSKDTTHYPEHLSREYMRIANAYMTLLNIKRLPNTCCSSGGR